jgi:hypothetical protein
MKKKNESYPHLLIIIIYFQLDVRRKNGDKKNEKKWRKSYFLNIK